MLHTKFQVVQPEGSNEQDFEYFSMYFYAANTGPPSAGPFSTLGSSFEQTW